MHVEVKIRFNGYLSDFVVRHRNVMINIKCCGKRLFDRQLNRP